MAGNMGTVKRGEPKMLSRMLESRVTESGYFTTQIINWKMTRAGSGIYTVAHTMFGCLRFVNERNYMKFVALM